jgi:hypothetical protein
MPDSGKQYIPNSILLHQAINPISALMAAIGFFILDPPIPKLKSMLSPST